LSLAAISVALSLHPKIPFLAHKAQRLTFGIPAALYANGKAAEVERARTARLTRMLLVTVSSSEISIFGKEKNSAQVGSAQP
jgi:hypothetical protein